MEVRERERKREERGERREGVWVQAGEAAKDLCGEGGAAVWEERARESGGGGCLCGVGGAGAKRVRGKCSCACVSARKEGKGDSDGKGLG